MTIATRHGLLAVCTAFGLAFAGSAFGHAGGGGGGGGSAGGGAGGGAGAGAGHEAGSTASAGTMGAGASGPGGAGAPGATSRRAAPDCGPGFVLKGGTCLRVTGGILPDHILYAQGRALALAGDYTRALPILEAVVRADDPMVFTMRGFALRKLGHFDQAMALYRRALQIDPGNVNTHEYLGEGYVTAGDLDLARIELAKVAQGCGNTQCEQYADLKQAIETGRTE